jgi:membrane dipeptidase
MQTPEGRLEDMDWDKTFVLGLDNVSALPLFTQAMVRRGFTDGDIKKILGENAMRVFKQAWKG